ncbi:MAG: aldehyde dehydrogenase (NADP(+)) [Propionicimonas sp.]|uniref:aldehyde dehydrogenase (NADP(+)) n=1 Tax=Propionicimonas sp. TaxID=1955623 RepID=UPI002B215743|nr:aldehyde dehydrogenase (NADP(+)) [Propionicimonas sp.]MEA4944509.1 aldehyde dehydrogenase (NADP(+)) [Propionicimonas sp.]
MHTTTRIAEVDRATELAGDAFAATVGASDDTRAGWLRAIADALDAHVDDLVALADGETALGAARLTGEVARTTGQLRLFAAVLADGGYLEAIIDHAAPGRPDLRRMLRPLGPVAVYAASNFPFAFSVAGGDTASALAVGCPVVVKAHPGHPETSRRTAALVTEALAAAGAPVGAFGLVEGFEAGLALIDHPAITAAAFTGSVAGGRALFDRAAARPAPIPFFGELGSINPVVVTEAADAVRGAELAAGLAASFQLGVGQFCTKPGLVFVPEGSVLEAALPAQVGRAPHRLLTEAIARGFRAGLEHLAGVPGAALVAGTVSEPAAGPEPLVYAVDLATFTDPAFTATLTTEVFGPVTLLVRYPDAATLVGALAALEGSLTATVHAEPDEDVTALSAVLADRVGRLLFGGWPTGVAVTWSQQHGGPWPATTSQHTSVGATAVRRFQRPIVYQDAPEAVLPAALREDNPLGIPRRVDGVQVR